MPFFQVGPCVRACLRVLTYLRDTGCRPLIFASNGERGLDTYVDSSWGTRFSVSGCLVFYHGCIVHWFSKMQKSVSLSSAEAEYFGAMMVSRDLVWLRELLTDLGVVLVEASVIFSDSKSAVDMAFDPIAFKQTKHIMRACFLRRYSFLSTDSRHDRCRWVLWASSGHPSAPRRILLASVVADSSLRLCHINGRPSAGYWTPTSVHTAKVVAIVGH